MRKPTMSTSVHYVDPAGEGWPAVVRANYELDAELVDLTAFTTYGQVHADRVRMDDGHASGTWHWPEDAQSQALGREAEIAEIHRTIDEITIRRTLLDRRLAQIARQKIDLDYERRTSDLGDVSAEITAGLGRIR